jgi:predicted ATPase/class 3 adenylate cyclase
MLQRATREASKLAKGSADSSANTIEKQRERREDGRINILTIRDSDVREHSAVTTLLFTDIEESTRLWEQVPERMTVALAHHDAIARSVIESYRGTVVKTTGDGVHAVFDDSLDAVLATVQFQQALEDSGDGESVSLRVRCGLHAGEVERRDNDFFGSTVNRAARIMSAAHGGQVLVSQAVADRVGGRLPATVGLLDLGAVRLRDLARSERLYQVLHPKLRREFPPLRSLEVTPNNLPQQVSSFVGRERALAEVTQLLGNTRLLTLVGVGGLGKTRLSLHVAADVIGNFRDGVWLVELAPLSDPRIVPQAVAAVLGVKEEAGRPVQEALGRFVKDRQLLLVLDNCEHLVHACAELAKQLLASGSQVKILTSSREHLHVAGETTYSMPTLEIPEAHQPVTVDTLGQYEAVRLFVARAVAAQPAFRLTRQNAAAVADICRRLDGIPLAIELAAARVRSMSAERIAERLGDRFRLLTGGDKTALPRQQTLRALIDWSYDLLSDSERALFRRLAVFAGGWMLEAAEAVGAGGEIDESAVLDLLTHLLEKSLVTLKAEGERYRLLDTVRQYAQERLFESGDGNETRARHLAFYLGLAEKARPELVGPEQATWLRRIDAEAENLLAVHAWCEHAERGAEPGLRLVSAMRRYLMIRGRHGLGYRLAMEALARPGAQQRTAARSRGLFDVGQLASSMGRYAEAKAHLEESIAIAREIGDNGRVAAALQPLGQAMLGLGDIGNARGHLQEALALAQEMGNKREVAAAFNSLAQLYRAEGDLMAAEPLYGRVLELARELGDRESTAIGLLNLAMVSIGQGFPERARAMLLEVSAIAEEIGSKPAGLSLLEVAAGLAVCQQDWEHATMFYGAAEAQVGQSGLQRDRADEAFLSPLIAKAREALGAMVFAAAVAGPPPYEEAMAKARAWLERCA